ncbi:methyltransferase domain-containing protein [Paeniclostridium sordellii]|uniref:class I SAM-dependent methyltransferase n=1 Tax=Paraclostridium sordellii TaxID=1505 RepID=UPI0012EE8EDC|nr:methyltransferase domain-containing protein [Paeniclostridium sordellii]MDU2686193.1 methyltransferase domain-containing protein [Paeniclostridium sordellii]MVO72923.1 methyltransferase domain-containing protein [Paeniclostridium sordellii]
MKNWFDFYDSLKNTYGAEPEHKIIEYIDLIEKGKVLDLGVGTGRNSFFLSALGYEVEGVDISKENITSYLNKAKNLGLDLKGTVMDIKNFEIKENEYSLIIVSWVLNFFRKSEIDIIIEKIKKGLKKDGIVYFSAFSILDDFYIENLDRFCGEENTLYFEEYKTYRYHYSSKDEILNYFDTLETISIKTGMELDIDENIGKHYHHTIEYIGKK